MMELSGKNERDRSGRGRLRQHPNRTPGVHVNHSMITTAFELPGHRVLRSRGLVRGLTVRSRSIIGSLGGMLQTIFGGNITIYTELCERTREEAFRLMVEHAERIQASAIIGVRYDANEVVSGVTEVLCYGTAVDVQPLA